MRFSRSDALHEQTNEATVPSDLFPLLNQIKLSDLQQFLHDQINDMDIKRANAVYHQSFSINDIFSTDALRHILSFTDCNKHNAVCTKWNNLSIQNEQMMLRAMYQTLTARDPETAFVDEHSYWVLHPTRLKLHPIEIGLEFKGLLHSLRGVMTYCKPGDRVLVHPGYYDNGGCQAHPAFKTDLHFIGVGDGSNERCSMVLSKDRFFGTVTFENLHLLAEDDKIRIDVPMSKVVFKQCNVDLVDLPVDIGVGASFMMTNCVVRGPVGSPRSAISISARCKPVEISNNKFVNFGRCIEINGKGASKSRVKSTLISISDNIFANASLKPVVERTGQDEEPVMLGSEGCILRGNRFETQDRLFSQLSQACNILHHVVEHDQDYETNSPGPSLPGGQSPTPDDAYLQAIMRLFTARFRRET